MDQARYGLQIFEAWQLVRRVGYGAGIDRYHEPVVDVALQFSGIDRKNVKVFCPVLAELLPHDFIGVDDGDLDLATRSLFK